MHERNTPRLEHSGTPERYGQCMNAHVLKMKRAIAPPEISLPAAKFSLPPEIRENISSFAKKAGLFATIAYALYYPRTKNRIASIAVGILLVDALLGVFVFLRIFTPPSAHIRASMALAMEPLVPAPKGGTLEGSASSAAYAAGSFYSALEAEGLSVSFSAKGSKPGMSVEGTILNVSGDSVWVFEYPNGKTAAAEAAALQKKYADATARNVWAAHAHVYVKDSTAIFYLGTRADISAALAGYAGEEQMHASL